MPLLVVIWKVLFSVWQSKQMTLRSKVNRSIRNERSVTFELNTVVFYVSAHICVYFTLLQFHPEHISLELFRARFTLHSLLYYFVCQDT